MSIHGNTSPAFILCPKPWLAGCRGLFPANALCMFLVHMQIPEAWCTSASRSPFSLPGWHLEPSSSVKESLGRTYLSTKGRRSMYWRHVYKTQSAFLHGIPSNWWYNLFWTGIIFLNTFWKALALLRKRVLNMILLKFLFYVWRNKGTSRGMLWPSCKASYSPHLRKTKVSWFSFQVWLCSFKWLKETLNKS